MVWDEMQRLGFVLVVYNGMSLNTWAWVKQWLWGFGWWFFPWYLPFSLTYFSCDSNAYVPIIEKLHVCEKQLIEVFHDIHFIWMNFSVKQTLFGLTTVFCHLRTGELFFLCLRTSKTVNLGEFVSRLLWLIWGQVICSFFVNLVGL